MAPIVHCIRHAQGYHNLSEENQHKYHDPDLTPRGREQCERLRERFPYHDQLDLIISSPIRRTIQTALIGLQPSIKAKGLKLKLAPRAQETSSKPSDTGSDPEKLKEEYGDKLDYERLCKEWNSNEGEWKMDNESIEQHVRELRRVIRDYPHEHVALVAHGGFLHYFTEDWSDNPGSEGETGWMNTEFRSYQFVDGPGAHLKETKESRELRANRPNTGFERENGASHEL